MADQSPMTADVPTGNNDLARRFPRGISALLLALACIFFICGGPVRAVMLGSFIDFRCFYAGTRAWLQGSNPYDRSNSQSILIAAGDDDSKHVFHIVNVPVTFPLLTPFVLLDWPTAKILWAGFQIALLIATLLVLLVGIAGWSPTNRSSMGYMALIFFMFPTAHNIIIGQLAIPATFLIVLGLYCETRQRDWLAGVMLALATCVKPQMGVFFLLLALSHWRWRTWLSAAVVGVTLVVVSLGQLYIHHIDWISTLQENYRLLFSPGGLNDSSSANSIDYGMVDLQIPLRLLFSNNMLISFSALGLAGAMALATLWMLGKPRNRRDEVLAYSIVAVFSLLAVYHKHYDAILLALPLLWAFMSLQTSNRWPAVLTIVSTAPFYFVSWTGFLARAIMAGYLPQWIRAAWWWRILLVPHYAYALAFLAACLFYATWKNRRSSNSGIEFVRQINGN
jgi:hypothetical protein